MKRLSFVFAAILAVACSKEIVTVIPEPVSMELGCGKFAVAEDVEIVCADSSLVKTAQVFSSDVSKVLGYELPVAVGKRGDVKLSLDKDLAAEEYVLKVKRGGIKVKGGSPAGVFYGLQTVKQLMNEGKVPAVKVTDKPFFAYRFPWRQQCG